MPITFENRVARARKIFWLAFAIFVVILIGMTWGTRRCLGDQRDTSVEPVLKGAPQFIVLSLAWIIHEVSSQKSKDALKG